MVYASLVFARWLARQLLLPYTIWSMRPRARVHTHTNTGEEAAHSVWAMMHASVDNLEMAHDRKGEWRGQRVRGRAGGLWETVRGQTYSIIPRRKRANERVLGI